jgi:two-component system response regulator RegX3
LSPIEVLVVEDEESYIDALQSGLRREGFNVHIARDGDAAIRSFEKLSPDLVLLDVMLPNRSGVEVCREIRRKSQVPIIMVTARSEEVDMIVGLEVGADDYVTKPYRLRELVARMRSVLRRSDWRGEADLSGDVLQIDGVRLDPDRHEVAVGGEMVSMPLKEFALLELLMENAGRVLPRDTLIYRVWGSDYVGDTKTLDVHIKRLRSKIEADPGKPNHIVTIRGLGYKFSAPGSAR